MQELLSSAYRRFVEIVAKERPQLTIDRLTNEIGAQIYAPARSKELGFIDEANSDYSTALKDLAQAAGIDEIPYQVITLEKKKSWLKEMMEKSPLLSGKIKHEVHVGPYQPSSLQGKLAYLFLPPSSLF